MMKSTLRQVACRGCETLNTLDSKFCKNCGTQLHEDDRNSALEQNRLFVQEGFKALNESRIQEAVLIAKNAIEHHSDCVEGYSLLGEARERDHDFPAALAAYEKALELEPTSSVHKLKIENLKQLIATDTLTVRRAPTKRFAVLAAASSVVVVACVGSAIALSMKDSFNAKSQTGMGTGDTNKVPVTATPQPGDQQQKPEGEGQPQAPTTDPKTATQKPADQPKDQPDDSADESDNSAATPNPRNKPVLPPATRRHTASNPSDFAPAQVNIPDGGIPVLPNPGKTGRPTVDDDPAPDSGTQTTPPVQQGKPTNPTNPTNSTTPNVKPDPKKGRKPIVQITPSKNDGGGNSGGGETGGGHESILKNAQQAFIAGQYESAVSLYQRAVSSGAPAGRCYQRMGMAYERLGRKADAISSYQRAISSYEASGSSAGHDAAEACRRAIEALRG